MWLVVWLIWSHVTFQFSFQSIITNYHFSWHISAFKPRFHTRTLVGRLHANMMAHVRQDLQTKVTDAFVHLNTRAPIARKEKNSTWPFKLSLHESNCKSYSASHSSVCSSRCLNPLLSLLFSYPSVWLSGWLSRSVLFTQLIFFCSKSIHQRYAGSFPNSKMDTDDVIYSLLWRKRWFVWFL